MCPFSAGRFLNRRLHRSQLYDNSALQQNQASLNRDVVLGTRTRVQFEYRYSVLVLACYVLVFSQCTCTCTHTRQTSSKLPNADVSALIFLKCNDMSCVWHASTSTSTRPNCLLSHRKHETISRVWVFIQFQTFLFLWKKAIYVWLAITLVLADTVFLLESNVLVLATSVLKTSVTNHVWLTQIVNETWLLENSAVKTVYLS